MSHWYGLRPSDLDDMTRDELNTYVQALNKLPPVGWMFMGAPKK